MVLFWLIAVLTLHVRTALALAGDHIAVVIQRTSRVAVTRSATVSALRKSVGFSHALVTVATCNQSLACTFTSVEIAAEIVDSSETIARTLFATVGVFLSHVPVAFFANIAATSFDVSLAVTSTSFSFSFYVSDRIANSIIKRSNRVAVTRFAGVGRLNILIWITVEERHALFAVLSLGVMFTIVANTAANFAGVLINCLIKVAADRVVVAVTF
jgi:hypothetical protein